MSNFELSISIVLHSIITPQKLRKKINGENEKQIVVTCISNFIALFFKITRTMTYLFR